MRPDMTMLWGVVGYKGVRLLYSMLFFFSNLFLKVPKLHLTMCGPATLQPIGSQVNRTIWAGKTSGIPTDLRAQLGSASKNTSR